MSYEIKYKETDSVETQDKAIQDCKDWLGEDQFNKVVGILRTRDEKVNQNMMLLALSFQGIQGYPAEVMLERYWAK
jgi:hypothetical protein